MKLNLFSSGIYIKPDDTKVPNRFRGIGIRIEDDIVITDTGYDVLSDKCPKSVESIEDLFKIPKTDNRI
jgi:Xaa-Pro aminopeptidase